MLLHLASVSSRSQRRVTAKIAVGMANVYDRVLGGLRERYGTRPDLAPPDPPSRPRIIK
jgi:hypothetical protein